MHKINWSPLVKSNFFFLQQLFRDLGGIIVTYGATSGAPNSFPIQRLFLSNSKICGTAMGSEKDFHEMLEFVKRHNLVIPYDGQRDFETQIVSSLHEMKEAKHFGKIVLTFNHKQSNL